MFGEADEGDVVGWMRQLEDEEGLSPLWEVFFQIAAYPVPQVTESLATRTAADPEDEVVVHP